MRPGKPTPKRPTWSPLTAEEDRAAIIPAEPEETPYGYAYPSDEDRAAARRSKKSRTQPVNG